MNQKENIPSLTNKSLIVAVLSALAIAVLAYFTIILPAEYNIDPTGLGKKLGLTVLSEPIDVPTDDGKTTEADRSNDDYQFREDTVFVTVPANSGVEYKFELKAFAGLTYDWKTHIGSDIYFDFHGEPAGDTTGFFESYTIASSDKMKGTTTVPFDGSHGWYWKNSTSEDVTIELKTSGNYLVIGLK